MLDWGGQNLSALVKRLIEGGGYGPGSYYPWIYLQMVVLIPLMRPICEKLGKWKSLAFFLVLSIVLEIACSITNLPDSIYRLLCFRYIFLIWVAWIWVKDGIRLNALTISASFISLVAIVYFAYFNRDMEPLFYNTGWATHRWVCYFWCGFAFVGILHWIYKRASKLERINRFAKMLASASYEIFLIQMAYYALIPLHRLDSIGNDVIQFGIWFTLAFTVSIAAGIALYKLEKSLS